MRRIHIEHHWLGRLLASDPGWKRFQQAGKATLSLVSSVLTMLLILHLSNMSIITPAIVSGIAGLLGIMIVMDETRKSKQWTTFWMFFSASFGITAGSLLAGNPFYIGTLMLAIIFCSFYLSRFNVRYFSISMIAFMSVYIASVLKLSTSLLPWFYLGISIGIAYAFLYNFVLFKDSAYILKRSMRSFHIQINLTFNILIEVIEDKNTKMKRLLSLEKNVRKLSEYARNVSNDLNEEDIAKIWPGLATSQLRLYVFDTEMLVETLTDSVKQLKKAEAFETDEIRLLLSRVVTSLRDVEVLDPNYDERNLPEAEKALQELRMLLTELMNQEEKPSNWLYLIRRIESITNHVIKAAFGIQQALEEEQPIVKNQQVGEEESEVETSEEESGLKPSTKKAYQALVAGVLSIIVGQFISPIQPYWVLLTAFIVLLGTESIGRTYTKGYQRSLGTVIGAVVGFALANLVSGHSGIEVILLFVVVFLAFYLLAVSYTLMSMFITMLIAFMYDLLLGGISLTLLGARVIDTVAGAAIALGVSLIVFPMKTKDKVADTIDDFLSELEPYLRNYIRGFREDVDVKALSDNAFTLDQKLYTLKEEARTLLQRREALSPTGYDRWITIFTAINYFARHLVASSYRKNFEYPDELVDVFVRIEEKIGHNINILKKLIQDNDRSVFVYSLKSEREQIERLAPSRNHSKRDLIHHLYYVWRINQSIVALSVELGSEEK